MNKKLIPTAIAIFCTMACSGSGVDDPAKKGKDDKKQEETVEIKSVPAELGLDSFYTKYVDANGIPVVSSSKTSDKGVIEARRLVTEMLKDVSPQVRLKLKECKTYMIVMSKDEVTTDIPEYAYLKDDPDTDWDQRARGLGGNEWYPYTCCAEENVLHLDNDRYYNEDITIHEFSHTIHNLGLAKAYSDFNDRLTKLYNDAKAAGKWANTYADDNIEEYFAEGVQDWYDVNIEVANTNGIHNRVNTREELERYDKGLYDFIAEFFEVPDEHFSNHPKVNLYNYE